MSVFQNILGKIFGRRAEAAPASTPATAAPPAGAAGSTTAAPTPTAPGASGSTTPSSSTTAPGVAGSPSAPAANDPGTANAPSSAAQAVDVEAVLTDLAAKNPQKLNWRTSIVDLLKLLDLDNSLTERKSLAKELGYSGDENDSAAMNIWLHKAVMRRLAENGGKVPDDMKD